MHGYWKDIFLFAPLCELRKELLAQLLAIILITDFTCDRPGLGSPGILETGSLLMVQFCFKGSLHLSLNAILELLCRLVGGPQMNKITMQTKFCWFCRYSSHALVIFFIFFTAQGVAYLVDTIYRLHHKKSKR